MANAEKPSPLLLCTSCGRPAEPGQHICEHCGAPVTPYAHTDPVLGIMARGFAAHKATTNPQKPIVVIGIWLWMAPMFILGVFMTRFGVGILVDGVAKRELWGLIGLPAVLIGLAFIWIAGGILLKTTLRYLESGESQQQLEDSDDSVECLECGHIFAADVDSCPKCGWSYSKSSE